MCSIERHTLVFVLKVVVKIDLLANYGRTRGNYGGLLCAYVLIIIGAEVWFERSRSKLECLIFGTNLLSHTKLWFRVANSNSREPPFSDPWTCFRTCGINTYAVMFGGSWRQGFWTSCAEGERQGILNACWMKTWSEEYVVKSKQFFLFRCVPMWGDSPFIFHPQNGF